VISFVVADILETAQIAVRAEQWHDQPAIAGRSNTVRLDTFASEVWMVLAGGYSAAPDGLDGICRDFRLALPLLVTSRPGLALTPDD
jgi:hypothetical protein